MAPRRPHPPTGRTIEVFLDGVSQGRDKGEHSGGAITTDLRALGSDRFVAGKKKGGLLISPGVSMSSACSTGHWTRRRSPSLPGPSSRTPGRRRRVGPGGDRLGAAGVEDRQDEASLSLSSNEPSLALLCEFVS